MSNPLIVAVIIGDYSNSPLPSITSASDEYMSIVDAFYGNQKYDVVFATTNNNDDDEVSLVHLKQENYDKNYESKYDFKLKWQEGELDHFNDKIKDEVLNNTENIFKLHYDSLIYIISAHGNQNKLVYNSDGEEIYLEFIFNEFNNKNCKQFRQRPKIYMLDINRTGSDTISTYTKHSSPKANLKVKSNANSNHLQIPSTTNVNLKEKNSGNSNNDKWIRETYMKESHCRKIFVNSREQPISNVKFNGSLLIQSLAKIASNSKLMSNCNFDDLLSSIRHNMIKILDLHENEIDTLVLNDHSTMPYNLEFVNLDCKIESALNQAENQSVIQFTVCYLLYLWWRCKLQ